MKTFNQTWAELAEEHLCDGIGGAEYRRVALEYIIAEVDARTQSEREEFILSSANRGPETQNTGEIT